MKLKNSVKRVLIVAGVLAGLSYTTGKIAEAKMNPDVAWKQHFVEQGESVWSLAEESNVQHKDVREVVDLIQEHNQVQWELKPGMVIDVPVAK